jgi:hypothetical protein
MTERSLAKRLLVLVCCVAAASYKWYSDVLELLRTVCWVVPWVVLTQPARRKPLVWSLLKDIGKLARLPFSAAILVVSGTLISLILSVLRLREDMHTSAAALKQASKLVTGDLRWPGLLPACALMPVALPAAAAWLLFVVAWSLLAAALCLYQLIMEACILTVQCSAAACRLCG